MARERPPHSGADPRPSQRPLSVRLRPLLALVLPAADAAADGGQRLLVRLASAAHRRSARWRPSWRPSWRPFGRPSWRPFWGSVAAVAAAVVLVVLLAWVIGLGQGDAAPPLQLAWQPVNLPAGATLSYYRSFPTIMPGNPNSAYACFAAPSTPAGANQPRMAQLWVTADRGAHWTHRSNLPLARPDLTTCYLTPDALDAHTLLAVTAWAPTSSAQSGALQADETATFVTHDGGATWSPLADPAAFATVSLATWHGVAYALRCCAVTPTTSATSAGIFVSADGLRTWQRVDGAITATGQHVIAFWLRPDTGEMLAEGWNPAHAARLMWTSRDGGRHWTALTVPTADTFFVLQPAAGQPWEICGVVRNHTDPRTQLPTPKQLTCSSDGGHSWSQRPVPSPTTADQNAPNPLLSAHAGTISYGLTVIGFTGSGDLLAMDTLSGSELLSRLAPGSSQWQALGTVPVKGVFPAYAGSGDGGVVWAVPLPQSGGSLAAAGRIFTAVYPED